MSNYELRKGKHLIMEDRLIIEYGLDENYTLKEIADRLKKDPTTISKEKLNIAETHRHIIKEYFSSMIS